jgi:cell division protein FtsI/penicillin-binding protein 2
MDTSRPGVRFVTFLILCGAAIIIARLFYLQILSGEYYKNEAEKKYSEQRPNDSLRGDIFYTKKDGVKVSAATTVSGYRVMVQPALLSPENFEPLVGALAEIGAVEKEIIAQKLQGRKSGHVEVLRYLQKEQADKVRALGIKGVEVGTDFWRMYPGKQLASKVIGFVGYKDNTIVGQYGVERSYHEVLSRTGSESYVNIFAQIFANVQSTIIPNNSIYGDVVTTIEPVVQLELESVLRDVYEKRGSDAVGAVLMDPYTGEIVAMAHMPDFDLNQFSKEKDQAIYQNPMVQSVFELGSVVKPLVIAAGIDSGAITPETSYTDKGSVEVRDRTFSNFDKKARGYVSMQEVLTQSLNTGMVYAQQKMGKDVFRSYMLEHFMLGEKTGIDLPGEIGGLVRNLKSTNEVDFAAASFGQGVAVSPIALVRGFAALANGGDLVTPHVGRSYVFTDGKEEKMTFPIKEDVISEETSKTMTRMMVKIVDDGFGAGVHSKERYAIAAKTGTAQIARPDGKGYYDDRNLHSLVGYFPAYEPRFVLYMFNMNPKSGQFASETLGQPFFDMVDFLIGYYELLPDR